MGVSCPSFLLLLLIESNTSSQSPSLGSPIVYDLPLIFFDKGLTLTACDFLWARRLVVSQFLVTLLLLMPPPPLKAVPSLCSLCVSPKNISERVEY